ncbi:MAG: polysaccharide export outer membrane protein [Halioglobus sp.]|jgi:polysaccharide export outer membrane protein
MHILRSVGVTLLLLLAPLATAQEATVYVLAPGDHIAISVFGQQDLSVDFTLGDNGTVSYPFLGEVRIAGLTMPELEKHIADGLRGDYLINPEVIVSMKQYRSFFLTGEVNRPGSYLYQPGLTLEKALALASGLSPRAAHKKIVVKRASGSSSAELSIKMSDPVYAGDVITVPQSFF